MTILKAKTQQRPFGFKMDPRRSLPCAKSQGYWDDSHDNNDKKQKQKIDFTKGYLLRKQQQKRKFIFPKNS
jgi:hypothetical protein